MLSKKELEEYMKIRRLKNLGQVEKDYLQNIILFILSRDYRNELIFKGGTALQRCYGLDRFSEDLDFNASKKINISESLDKSLRKFLINFEIETKYHNESQDVILRLEGPLFNGSKRSLCRVELDISSREKILLTPLIKTVRTFLTEIPSFEILVMSEEEILAEKVRAIITRNVARDVYDFWFLLNKGIKPDLSLINNKLFYYNKKFSKAEFFKKLNEKKDIWKFELEPLVMGKLPDFKEVKRLTEKII